MTDYIVPLLLLVACVFALRKQENSYDLLLSGAADGLKLLITLIPTLVLLLTAVTMLRASGAMEIISKFLSPAFRLFGIPPETAMLVLIRPISGSAALAVNDFLHHQRVFRRCRDQKDALYHTGCAVCGFCRIFYGLSHCTALDIKRACCMHDATRPLN